MDELHREVSSSERRTEVSHLWGFFGVWFVFSFFSVSLGSLLQTQTVQEERLEKMKEQTSINYTYTRGKKFKTGDKTSEAAACLTLRDEGY